jgi:hypothetical protein
VDAADTVTAGSAAVADVVIAEAAVDDVALLSSLMRSLPMPPSVTTASSPMSHPPPTMRRHFLQWRSFQRCGHH